MDTKAINEAIEKRKEEIAGYVAAARLQRDDLNADIRVKLAELAALPRPAVKRARKGKVVDNG